MKRRLLITDGIAIPKSGDYSFSIVMKKECIIEDVTSLLQSEKLECNDIVLVNVGSYNISAKHCGWDHKLIIGKDACELIEDIVNQFKNHLEAIVKHAAKRQFKVIFCGLVPLPDEQDYSSAPKERKKLADMLSRLFVRCNQEIGKVNGENTTTLCLEKYCSASGSKRYVSGQIKIKNSYYDNGELNQERKKHLILIISDFIKKLK